MTRQLAVTHCARGWSNGALPFLLNFWVSDAIKGTCAEYNLILLN